MNKYKVGDKIVLTVSDVNEKAYYSYYVFNNNDLILWEPSTDKYAEPLSTYTKPLEAKISRQAAEITRLLRENNELKEQMKFDLPTLISEEDRRRMDISKARAEGAEAAWELARKIFDMETNDIEDIFITEDAWNLGTVLNNYTYPEAAAKVKAWEKAKEEIKVGDIYEGNIGSRCFVIRNIHEETNDVEILWLDLAPGNRGIEEIKHYKKTGRHIDIDSFLKQIGGEE